MSGQRYTISKAIRDKYRVHSMTEADLKKFINLNVELFSYLKEAKSVDFKIYFRVDLEFVEVVSGHHFSQSQIDLLLAARNIDYENVEICMERRDYPKFEALVAQVRDQKIDHLLKKDPNLDRKIIMNFANLSAASQMIVRGGINKEVAAKAKAAASNLINNLMDCHVAIGTLSRMILADGTLYDHSAAVAMIAGIIARDLLGKSKEEAEKIVRSGLYHDVGKTCVPGHILNKPGHFTAEEFEVLKKHAKLGYDELQQAIAQGAPIEQEVALVALEHHEKFNGAGYPFGKKGRVEEHAHGIHLYARIVMIADVYSALLMKRVYKEAYDQERALTLMRSFAATDYDPIIWSKFERSVTQSIDYHIALDRAQQDMKDTGRIIMLGDKGKLSEQLTKARKSAS